MLEQKEISIGITSKCVIDCIKCFNRYYYGKGEVMDDKIFNRIMRFFYEKGSEYSIFLASGEPLVCKHFRAIVDWSHITGGHITALTNGLPLTKQRIEQIKDINITVGITLDGITQDEIRFIQRGMLIEKVLHNLQQLKNYNIDFYINYTLYSHNIKSLMALVDLAADIGCQTIFITPVDIYEINWSYALWKIRTTTDFINKNITFLNACQKKADDFKIHLSLPKSNTSLSIYDTLYKCKKNYWFNPIIDMGGNVSACWGREDVLIGNVRKTELGELLNLPEYKIIREYIDQGMPHEICEECSIYFNSNHEIKQWRKSYLPRSLCSLAKTSSADVQLRSLLRSDLAIDKGKNRGKWDGSI